MALVPTVSASVLPWLTTDQMREIDRLMIEDLGIDLVRMMENAGRELARLVVLAYPEVLPHAATASPVEAVRATELPDGQGLLVGPAESGRPAPRPRPVTVYVGGGGNGGGGLTAARRLQLWGAAVTVVLGSERLAPVPTAQLTIARRLGLPIVAATAEHEAEPFAIAVDALVGYGLAQAPTGALAERVEALGRHRDVVALDAPTGLDTATGQVPGAAVTAGVTVTLAAPKLGLREPGASPGGAHRLVGELYVADISVPPAAYRTLGLPPGPVFGHSSLQRIAFPGDR